MAATDQRTDNAEQRLTQVLRQYWGYEGFRPLQFAAMQRVLDGKDSVVVLPTGGGKSLCFQAPALCLDGLAVVVSPLISLMKDQVDSLRSCGIAAACVNSSLSPVERREVAEALRRGEISLLYVAPERLLMPQTLEFLQSLPVTMFAIDEAHCISQWGHDFRPEYRELRILKDRFPGAGVHAYTATATPQVREDIARQLSLQSPEILVGSFDRPNLTYRVARRQNRLKQIREVLERHRNEAGIIYCISRAAVDRTCRDLQALGFRAAAYHAGLSDSERKANQEAFIADQVDIVVATVAFGMGIDKSNVRFVIHADMPKSLEAYQQESGRAGRDGLEAECCLFYGGNDFFVWQRMLEDSPAPQPGALAALQAIRDYCGSVSCRHRSLVAYFGEQLPETPCGACDVCLGELDLVDDPLTVAQKILSSVVRQGQRFGGDYTALVLKGSRDRRILQNNHDQLSTWGLLSDEAKNAIRHWIEQLVEQGYLEKTGEFDVLQVTGLGRELLKGQQTPVLLKPRRRKSAQASAAAKDSWQDVDRDLFEVLRSYRRELAEERGVPAYIVFSDAALRDMARARPTSLDAFRDVRGVGEKKLEDFGAQFVAVITRHLAAQPEAASDAETDPAPSTEDATAAPPRHEPMPAGPDAADRSVRTSPPAASTPDAGSSHRGAQLVPAMVEFRQGKSVAEVAEKLGRARSTVRGYLIEYIRQEGVSDWSPWVPEATAVRIHRAIEELGEMPEKLRPIWEQLDGEVSFDDIRIYVECLNHGR